MPTTVSKTEPLRGPERLEFARVALEEAVGRMVKNPDEKIYQVAVVSRYKELDELRGGMARHAMDRAKARE